MLLLSVSFFFFNDSASTAISTLSLHDALPICGLRDYRLPAGLSVDVTHYRAGLEVFFHGVLRAREEHLEPRSEEHTSELQSHSDLVCRLLLEKKKKKRKK